MATSLPRSVNVPSDGSVILTWPMIRSHHAQFASGGGWSVRRVMRWPWPFDPFRSTHVIKVMAPLLFPRATSVLWGDLKCVDGARRFPCAALRAPAGTDLLVPMNPWFRSRSIEGEFIATWQHMRQRHKTMQAWARRGGAKALARDTLITAMRSLTQLPRTSGAHRPAHAAHYSSCLSS